MSERASVDIELGNDAMSEPSDVAEALREVAGKIDGGETGGAIRDVNGNTVGDWFVNFPEPEPDDED